MGKIINTSFELDIPSEIAPMLVYLLSMDYSSQNAFGYTPLHISAIKGNLEIIKYLISKGVNVNCRSKNGFTPLHIAVINGHLDIVKYLVSCGAEINSITQSRQTPFLFSSLNRKCYQYIKSLNPNPFIHRNKIVEYLN